MDADKFEKAINYKPLSARAKHVRFDRRLKTFRNYVLGITAQSNSLVLLISPSPLEGEGRDEGGIIVVKHPSPFPLPQGERVHFNSDAKCIVRKHFVFLLCFYFLQ
jgi:hypothetical protein